MTRSPSTKRPRRQNHLEYYREHGIAPVRYDLISMEAHLQRREALYRKLGLLPIAFHGAAVLEVAAGTGHNSLYVAQLAPRRLVLLEPNAAAVAHIHAAYAGFGMPHTAPEIETRTLQEFASPSPFDIVLCENWLGTSERELALLDKLGALVASGGVLVVTTVSPIGFVPNLLRRFLVPYLVSPEAGFEAKSAAIERAFAPHLRTLAAMTRSARDWVQDNMLNPAYFGLCLSIPTVIERLGARFEAAGASPSFAEDWRWFKSQAGEARRMNEHFLDEYWRKALNYLDYREPAAPGDPELARRLERLGYEILAAVEAHEDAHLADRAGIAPAAARVREALADFIAALPAQQPAVAALHELAALRIRPAEEMIGAVAGMKRFGSLFGRETSYLSLTRNPAWAPGFAA
ncbi:MAG TPA: methyltransferase domain-containing protein [Usitatibacter sp.]|nr:methyltransferase domain-containing protein [Usitatibacter sp.]